MLLFQLWADGCMNQLTLSTSTMGLWEHRRKPLRVLDSERRSRQSGMYLPGGDLSDFLIWVSEAVRNHIERPGFAALRY